jgi:hypothetical protein
MTLLYLPSLVHTVSDHGRLDYSTVGVDRPWLMYLYSPALSGCRPSIIIYRGYFKHPTKKAIPLNCIWRTPLSSPAPAGVTPLRGVVSRTINSVALENSLHVLHSHLAFMVNFREGPCASFVHVGPLPCQSVVFHYTHYTHVVSLLWPVRRSI